MTRAFIGLGSNLGDRLANLRTAIEHLREHVEVLSLSSVYETDPVGPPQPPFLNAACLIETRLEPAELMNALKQVEQAIGRSKAERWGPREIDLDLLLYGDESIDQVGLVVPHAELTNRSFAMVPILEIDEEVELPSGEPLSAFCERDPQGVIKTELSL